MKTVRKNKQRTPTAKANEQQDAEQLLAEVHELLTRESRAKAVKLTADLYQVLQRFIVSGPLVCIHATKIAAQTKASTRRSPFATRINKALKVFRRDVARAMILETDRSNR